MRPPDVEAELDRVEAAHGVRVAFAIESGSRAWGFASEDSDFDVRFVYVRTEARYLSIDAATKRDVIEVPVDEVLDVSGWNLVKALNLYRRTNPPLFEWLHSPIVYRDRFGLMEELRELGPAFYNPKAAAYHYLRMTNNSLAAIPAKAGGPHEEVPLRAAAGDGGDVDRARLGCGAGALRDAARRRGGRARSPGRHRPAGVGEGPGRRAGRAAARRGAARVPRTRDDAAGGR